MAEVLTPKDKQKKGRNGFNGDDNGWESFQPGHNGSRGDGMFNKSVFGLLVFIATEIMIFAGLISAFIVLKANTTQWPPPGQPRLPVAITGLNTFFLLLSGVAIYQAVQALKKENQARFKLLLLTTGILGTVFLVIQGYEWLRLLGYGLTMKSSIYGSTFYTLIGAHGTHVMIAVLVLIWVLIRAIRGHYNSENRNGVVLCQIYWFFVVGIWPVLYLLVYF
ncbi:MAG: heme-copper oxidase subunit III [Calditrichaeota bacterium]|nr:MAG: heme-copper oxidase subunit III [Calditrichota bacterium]